jgi:uncharacterized membrane protein YidH (DUF202 family)
MKILNKLAECKQWIIRIVSRSSYQTDEKTRQEFEEFLAWYRTQIGRTPFTEVAIRKVVETYFKDKNIALYNIRRIEGAYTRNATKEFIIVLCVVVIGITIPLIVMFCYYG